ncbi:hypothetical protein P0F65_09845 [Sphingomonas sp. I4]
MSPLAARTFCDDPRLVAIVMGVVVVGVTARFEAGRGIRHGRRHVEAVVAHVALALRGQGGDGDQAERKSDRPEIGAAHVKPFEPRP